MPKRSLILDNHILAIRRAGESGLVSLGFKPTGNGFAERGASCLERLLPLLLGNGPLEISGGGLPTGGVVSGVNQNQPLFGGNDSGLLYPNCF